MTPAQTIAEFRSRGIILLANGGRLRIKAPPGVVSDQLRDWLSAHKADLLRHLSAPPLPELSKEDRESLEDAIEERAAIREHDGGETREVAEAAARFAQRVYRYRLANKPNAWLTLTLICPGCDLGEARHALGLKLGPRLLDVVEHAPRKVAA
jgi:hypothetical protein